jgi:hypothetical protein
MAIAIRNSGFLANGDSCNFVFTPELAINMVMLGQVIPYGGGAETGYCSKCGLDDPWLTGLRNLRYEFAGSSNMVPVKDALIGILYSLQEYDSNGRRSRQLTGGDITALIRSFLVAVLDQN